MSSRVSSVAASALSVSLIAASALTGPAVADVIYGTEDPFGGFFGINGFDIYEHQSQAVRFTTDAEYTLDQISVWFWHNEGPGTSHPNVTLTLRTDRTTQEGSTPSDVVLETWVVDVSQSGFPDPVLYTVSSVEQPTLANDTHYWLVAEAVDAPALDDPVWAWAAPGNGFMSRRDPQGGQEWEPGASQAVVSLIVEGTPTGGGGEYGLAVDGPVIGGSDARFVVTEARPNAATFLAYSLAGPGSTPVPPLNVTLDLARPSQAGDSARTNANGAAAWTLFVPTAARGRAVWLQSAQREATSNVIRVDVQ